jgi:hypothetical protein
MICEMSGHMQERINSKVFSLSLASAILTLSLTTTVGQAGEARRNANIEMAAKINVAENICDINFGNSLLHYVMLAANDLNIEIEAAAKLGDKREAEIVRYLNSNSKLDQFCQNARNGKL